MITREDVIDHKKKYPNLKHTRLIMWLNKEERWADFKTVPEASRALHTWLQIKSMEEE